jgi:MYXO-CTERM domain-containing protein
VSDAFQIEIADQGETAGGRDVIFVAFPLHITNKPYEIVTPKKDVNLVQGYRPRVYALPSAKLAELEAASSGGDDAVKPILESAGKPCTPEVNRLYQAPESTGLARVMDVWRIERADASGCSARAVRTVFVTTKGDTLEAEFTRDGTRQVPEQFAAAFPNAKVADASPSPSPAKPDAASEPQAPSTAGEPKSGCAGCAASGAPTFAGAVSIAALAGAIATRRRRRMGWDSAPLVSDTSRSRTPRRPPSRSRSAG